jgi:hypothetical protein
MATIGAVELLCLAAAPTFAIMAVLAGVHGGGAPHALCAAAHDGSPFGGMAEMYALMSLFHTPPWLKLLPRLRAATRRS